MRSRRHAASRSSSSRKRGCDGRMTGGAPTHSPGVGYSSQLCAPERLHVRRRRARALARRCSHEAPLTMNNPITRRSPAVAAGERAWARLLAVASALLLAACGASSDNAAPGGQAGGGGPPPPEVGVITVQQHPVGLVTELPGRLEATRVAQVRARAAGILLKRLFAEGSDVTRRPGAVPDRLDRVPGQPFRGAGDARARAGVAHPGGRAGRALQAAARGERHQQAGLRQRGRGAEDRRGRRRGGARQRRRPAGSTSATRP